MKFSRALLASVAVVATMGAAHAADLIVEDIAPATLAAAHDWSGMYVGVSGGYGSGTVDWTAQGYDNGVSLGALAFQDDSFDASGWLLGVQAGANMQMDSFVFGVEGDLDWTNISGSMPINDSTITANLDWMGSLRARAGFAVDSILIYGTAGLAAGGGSIDVTNINQVGDPLASENFTSVGWTAGVGAEVALDDNISLRAEYRYTSLTLDEVQFGAPVQYGGSAAGDYLTVNGDVGVHSIKAGLNFSF